MPQTYEFHGYQANDVLELLKKRKEAGFNPSSDDDGNKVALLFEGGAMGGLVSAAAGAELASHGYLRCFDTVYGTSSGALNAAYFVAGQIETVLDIYKIETLAPEFMGLWRWPDQVNVKWLARRITEEGPRRLDLKEVNRAPMELKISTTDVMTGKSHYFSNQTDPIDRIVPAITASSCTPLFVTHRETIDGREYSDGLVREGIQTLSALKDGHTHVLALLSKPAGRRKKTKVLRSLLEQFVRIRFYPPDFQAAFHARAVFYNDAVDLLHQGTETMSTLVICPDRSDPKIGHLEKDTEVLTASINVQKSRVKAIFSEGSSKANHRAIQVSDWYS